MEVKEVAEGGVRVCPLAWQDCRAWRQCGPCCAWWHAEGKCCSVMLALDRVEGGMPELVRAVEAVAGKLDGLMWAIRDSADRAAGKRL